MGPLSEKMAVFQGFLPAVEGLRWGYRVSFSLIVNISGNIFKNFEKNKVKFALDKTVSHGPSIIPFEIAIKHLSFDWKKIIVISSSFLDQFFNPSQKIASKTVQKCLRF